MNVWNIYEDLPDIGAVRRRVEQQMDEYNVSPGVVRLDLILFRDAIEHVCRIVRVISQVSDSRRVPRNGKHFIRRNVLLKIQICRSALFLSLLLPTIFNKKKKRLSKCLFSLLSCSVNYPL